MSSSTSYTSSEKGALACEKDLKTALRVVVLYQVAFPSAQNRNLINLLKIVIKILQNPFIIICHERGRYIFYIFINLNDQS